MLPSWNTRVPDDTSGEEIMRSRSTSIQGSSELFRQLGCRRLNFPGSLEKRPKTDRGPVIATLGLV